MSNPLFKKMVTAISKKDIKLLRQATFMLNSDQKALSLVLFHNEEFILLKNLAKFSFNVDAAIEHFIDSLDLPTLKIWLKYGLTPEKVMHPIKEQYLHTKNTANYISSLEMLLEFGVYINDTHLYMSLTPFTYGDIELYDFLDPHLNFSSLASELLPEASFAGNATIFKRLYSHVDDPAVKQKSFVTLCKKGHNTLVNYMINNNHDVTLNDSQGFRHACRGGHLELAKMLHKHGAIPTAQNGASLTWAAKASKSETLTWLLEEHITGIQHIMNALNASLEKGCSTSAHILIEQLDETLHSAHKKTLFNTSMMHIEQELLEKALIILNPDQSVIDSALKASVRFLDIDSLKLFLYTYNASPRNNKQEVMKMIGKVVKPVPEFTEHLVACGGDFSFLNKNQINQLVKLRGEEWVYNLEAPTHEKGFLKAPHLMKCLFKHCKDVVPSNYLQSCPDWQRVYVLECMANL